MATILNIDTSGPQCSLCVATGGEVVVGYESGEKMDHSVTLAPFIEKCMASLKEKGMKPDAVSISNGPGSYTGLRIGLSLAKGMGFGLDIPLITLSTLEVMTVRAMFSYPDLNGGEIIVPMIDARRMEVWTAAYNCNLESVVKPQAMILSDNSLEELYRYPKVLFIGDGITKFRDLYKGNNALWLSEKGSHAKYMAPLSEKYYIENKFADLAYSVPFYLKEYQTTEPKKKF